MKTLIIVESPTKAKTITKFLGKNFIVESSFGHIRDLPKSKMGIDIEGGTFLPTYTVSKEKTKQVNTLKADAKKCAEIIFATDEDREGEAISWHLANVLNIDPKTAKRIVFHEITKSAIETALKNPRSIDLKQVDAQQARRILDRLVGYELSPLLWKKVAKGLSAGRVQSVAVRLIVEREREILAFLSEEYWSVSGIFSSPKKSEHKFNANLHSINDKRLDKLDLKNKEQVDKILTDLDQAKYKVLDLKKSETKRTPSPPFTTSVLQQNANNRLGFSAKQTMVLAQQLYEGVELGTEGSVGLITYMRTDSVNLSEKFLSEAKEFVDKEFGKKYSLEKPRYYQNKSKNAQEAHEAIRPSDVFRTPESVKEYLSPQQYKLYDLIWRRALATQMSEAKLNKVTIDIASGIYLFKANGQTMLFDGWLKLFPGMTEEEILPELEINELINCDELKSEQHFTEPSARYSDATLVKALEQYGIGRPSTYAPTIATIEDRGYVERDDNKRLSPKPIAFIVNDLLVEHFPQIVDYQFTAQMEENLDEIAEGTKDWQPIIATFYSPFHELIIKKTDELSKAETTMTRELGNDPISGKKVSARIGRFGPFVQLGDKEDTEKPRFAKIPKEYSLGTITYDEAMHLFTLPRNLGPNQNGEDIIVNNGRFGPYAKVGSYNFSLRGLDPYTVSLEEVLNTIQEQADKKAKQEIKIFPDSDIKILDGRYGPYITDGKKNAKIPPNREPKSLELIECEELIKNAPERKKRFFRKKATSE